MIKLFQNQLTRLARKVSMALATLTLSVVVMQPVNAQISQAPLLTPAGAVDPNLMMIFDDSLSMAAQFVYQYGGNAGGMGRTGPGVSATLTATCVLDAPGTTCSGAFVNDSSLAGWGNFPTTLSITTTGVYNQPIPSWYWEQSPNVNGLYYNPSTRYNPRVNSTGAFSTPGTASSTAFNVYFYRDGSGNNVDWNNSGNDPTLSTSYFADTILTPYIPGTTLLAPSATPGLLYPRTVNNSFGNRGPFPKFINRTDCNGGAVGGSCSLAEERQNYANWKKYHSNRLDFVKTGLGYAFQNLTSNIRLGWSSLSRLNGYNSLPQVVDSGVGAYIQARKDAFYTWLYALNVTGGGTPTHFALDNVGKYFSRADNAGPWANSPITTSVSVTPSLALSGTTDTLAIRTAHYSCRRSFAMLTTDGYYGDGVGGNPGTTDYTGLGNIDATPVATIMGTTASGGTVTFTYVPSRPYTDTQSDTLADVAMKYWITDLRPDLINNVKQIPATVINGITTTVANESFWQNMGFYAVGLGVFGTMPQTASQLISLTTGTSTWPTMGPENETAIDDTWHATINSRGRILSAKNSAALNDAVEGMLADIVKNTSSQSGVAASTASLTNSTRKYTPKYTTGEWTGNVIATALDPSSGADLSVTWQVVGTDPSGITYNGIPGYSTRTIYAWNGLAIGSFDSLNIYVNSNVVGANTNLINYLRGDQTNEDPNGTALYRARKYLLGDIVNSSPVFIKGDLNSNYDQLPAGTYGQSSYATFVANKAARSEGVLFAGANDGMLHGFRDTTGAEIFAFVPRAVMPNLHLLASRNYTHQYYVDGPNVEADACLTGGSACTSWSNLLVGTTGAGAKSVFALDVTNPTSMNASSVKWEISPSTTGYASLGHVLTDVQTGLTASGQWVAIFGNGYYGASGVASLYIADLDTGALVKQISTGVGSSNGLGGVRLVLDANQRILGAYAGDLQGNLWKFDLSSSSTSSWGLGLSSSPLYKGTSTKAITAQPTIVAHPSGGNVVTFGTGKLFDTTDVSTTTTQSFYGIWDSVAFGSSTTPTGVTQTGVSSLVQQTISAAISGLNVVTSSTGTTSTVTINYYSVSTNTVDWATKRGWYINLPNTGQRVIYPSATLVNGYIFTDTLAPSNVSVDPCLQTGSGSAWNYIIDGLTGSGPTSPIIDTNGDRIINSADLLVAGFASNADGRTTVVKVDRQSGPASTTFVGLGGTSNTPTVTLPNPPTPTSISGVLKRSWRQLFLR